MPVERRTSAAASPELAALALLRGPVRLSALEQSPGRCPLLLL